MSLATPCKRKRKAPIVNMIFMGYTGGAKMVDATSRSSKESIVIIPSFQRRMTKKIMKMGDVNRSK
jgi:hypothetical protein